MDNNLEYTSIRVTIIDIEIERITIVHLLFLVSASGFCLLFFNEFCIDHKFYNALSQLFSKLPIILFVYQYYLHRFLPRLHTICSTHTHLVQYSYSILSVPCFFSGHDLWKMMFGNFTCKISIPFINLKVLLYLYMGMFLYDERIRFSFWLLHSQVSTISVLLTTKWEILSFFLRNWISNTLYIWYL